MSKRSFNVSPMRRARIVTIPLVAMTGLCCGAGDANLIINGDFEGGLVGINSDYVHTPNGNTDEGTWWAHPWDPGAPWHSEQHTRSGVGAMSANGDDSSQAGEKRVWFQSIPVEPGTTYRFSAWALATTAGFEGYSLRFAFDDVQVGGIISPTSAFTWEEFTATVVPTGAEVEVSIVNVSGITFPNDFMLDDLSLKLVVSAADLNCDGAVDGADLGILLGSWGDCAGCAADINGDGIVDGADLGLLLGDWT